MGLRKKILENKSNETGNKTMQNSVIENPKDMPSGWDKLKKNAA